MIEIISEIKRLTPKKDKNGNEFLVIKTNNFHIILVFSRVIHIEEGEELKVGQSYQFTMKLSNKSSAYSLVKFTRVGTFEIPAKKDKE